jgi:large subunit ribosomal protein L21
MKRDVYAIAEIAGDQVILEPGKQVRVPKLELQQGEKYMIDKVLYLRDGDKIQVGRPYIEGLQITAAVVEQKRLPKVVIFKKKRRKGYQVTKGHRQHFTVLSVDSLSASTGTKKKSAKAAPKAKVPAVKKQPEKSKES